MGSGLGNYTITYVKGTLTVNPAPLTITASNEVELRTGRDIASTAFTETGLVSANRDTVAGHCRNRHRGRFGVGIKWIRIPSVPVPLRSGRGLGNYTISYVNGTLTVNPAILTITAVDESKTYGTTLTPGATTQFTTQGLLNGDSVTSATLTSSGYAAAATVASPRSKYAIVSMRAPVGTGLKNSYTISYVSGALSVKLRAASRSARRRRADLRPDRHAGWDHAVHDQHMAWSTNDSVASVTLCANLRRVYGDGGNAPGPNYAITSGAAVGSGVGCSISATLTAHSSSTPRQLTITASNATTTYGRTTTFSPRRSVRPGW